MWLLSDKVTIAESGILEGMTDWHCHLIPNVDDGVEDQEEAKAILHLWEEAGVSEVWLTPHIMEDIPNKVEDLRESFSVMSQYYHGSIHLNLAAEHMMDNLLLTCIDSNKLIPIGHDGNTLLVETSYFNPPMDMSGIVEKICSIGLRPMLAHPERYIYMDSDDYNKWKDKGMLFQLNLPSLTGAYGPEVQKKAEYLLGKGLYDRTGTDTHSLHFAQSFLRSKLRKKTVRQIKDLIRTNP